MLCFQKGFWGRRAGLRIRNCHFITECRRRCSIMGCFVVSRCFQCKEGFRICTINYPNKTTSDDGPLSWQRESCIITTQFTFYFAFWSHTPAHMEHKYMCSCIYSGELPITVCWRMSLSIPLSSRPDSVSVRVPGGEQTEKQPRPGILFSPHIQNLRGHVLFT